MKKRKIQKSRRKVGKDVFFITLPYDWSIGMIEKGNNEVFTQEFDNKLLITPLGEVPKRETEITLKGDRPELLEAEIISAYLRNCDQLTINIQDGTEYAIEKIEYLRRKLLGTVFKDPYPNIITVSMETPISPIQNVLNEAFNYSIRISKKNEEIMNLILPTNTLPPYYKRQIDSWENNVDLNTFLTKRFLNRSLIDPAAYLALQIDSLQDILEYSNVILNIERFADIQVELFESITQFYTTWLKETASDDNESWSFTTFPTEECNYAQYYSNACKMVKIAFENSDSENADHYQSFLDILKSRGLEEEGMGYRPEFIEKDYRERIITESRASPYALDLHVIESKIWAISGVATNIAEAWMNMSH